ncbi:phosphorylase superfamily [Trichoderma arundinaceum]|uniref:Phosphorylase superfamily n=1 Tax=Trichoderma arundinaceum TaxID=490622 RepID=A0A395NJ62_TRIAR|nr:phosphorylase superfamily [Trichoderma arundinaceum]
MSAPSGPSLSNVGRHRPTKRRDFSIAIICALQVEYDAVCLLVDDFWDDEDFGQAEGDLNFYTTGCINNHNVVILLLASMGKTSAASAVASLRMSFTSIRLLLLVGICGGVPSGPRGEVLLGDVIIGDEVKLYDYGKRYPDGFRPSENFGYDASNFNRGTRGLLTFLETDRGTQLFEDRISHHLQHLQEVARSNSTNAKYAYPGAAEDKLFAPEYRHRHHQRAPCICRNCRNDLDPVCEEAIKASCLETNCDTSYSIPRQRIVAKQNLGLEKQVEAQRPTIHFGRLASADTVLKSAKDRDRLSQELQVIGFEMEAAGFYNELPYIVIKSVCDYADSHKAKRWQPFAAATAASACKALLERYPQTGTNSKEDSNVLERSVRNHSQLPIHAIQLLKNERFVGRQGVLRKLEGMLFHKQAFNRAALVGLGGVGKTQVALQLAYLMKDEFHDEMGRECSVLWIPALSMATYEQACADIARCIPDAMGAERDPKQIVKTYFSLKTTGRWFLVLDNADDYDLIFGMANGLFKYLPQSDLGCVLATTRDYRVAVGFAETNVVNLLEMDMDEAETFFRKSLIKKDITGAEDSIRLLLDFLERIPLAISQAAAYINVNQITIQEFLGLLRGVPHDQISLLTRHFHDTTRYLESQNAIALTWLASFDRIAKTDPAAAELLFFISCIEPKGIPRSLLPRGNSQEQFLHAIGTLLGYAFLIPRGKEVYDMHRLVHIATNVWAKVRPINTTNLAVRHIASIFPNDDYEDREKWRAYLPHSLRILRDNIRVENSESQILALRAVRCLYWEGRMGEAVSILEDLVANVSMLSEEDSIRLKAQRELARAYLQDRQIKKAISILERVSAVSERTMAEEHPDRLASQHKLAAAYLEDGRIKKAISILERVLTIKERTLTEEHPDRLASQHELAGAYLEDGQIEKAILLLEYVVAIRDKTLGEEHPARLASQHELAGAYLEDGQIKKAILLLEYVVDIEDKTLSKEHQDRLTSQHELARTYLHDGQVKKAIVLLEHVVSVQEKVLSEEHPERLASQHVLAQAYFTDGQVKKAISVLERVLAIRERILAEEHPSLLSSQHMLALSYHANQQTEKAVLLLEHVVSIRREVLREDHPRRLESEKFLAELYECMDNESVSSC